MEVIFGQRVALECDFRVAGVLTDPLSVVCLVRSPSGNLTGYSYPTDVTRDATGVYRCEFTADEDGSWAARFEGSGVAESVAEFVVSVRPSNVI